MPSPSAGMRIFNPRKFIPFRCAIEEREDGTGDRAVFREAQARQTPFGLRSERFAIAEEQHEQNRLFVCDRNDVFP